MENQEPRFRKVEAKKSKMHPGGLADWVQNEKWVDLRRKNKKGKFEPCGRNDTSKGKKPVCVPINKAKNLTEKQIKNRKRQKARKEKEPNPGKKPNTTKYTEQAGGKSNVSNNNNIRFIGSMIPLSELRPTQHNFPKFIKISGIEDEGGLVDPDTSKSPFEMPKSDVQNDREYLQNELKQMTDKDGILDHIIELYNSLENNLYEEAPNKQTLNAFKTLEINRGNEGWDEYYHMMVERMVNSMNAHIEENGFLFLRSDGSADPDMIKDVEQKMLLFLLDVASKVNIFVDNNYSYYLSSMFLKMLGLFEK
jgi:hypothetical protein